MHQHLHPKGSNKVLVTWGLASALLAPAASHAQFGRAEFSDAGDFSESAILSGVKATQAQCAAAANTVWAATAHSGAECIKYWKAGFGDQPVKRAIIFFHGDVFVGVGKTSKAYLELSNAQLQKNADDWAKKLGMPYIFMGRPGTHGSSGDHMQRRRVDESVIISAALDELKKRLDRRAKLHLTACGRLSDRTPLRQQFVSDRTKQRFKQRILRRKVIVQNRLGDTCSGRDPAHRCAIVALVGKDAGRSSQNPAPALFQGQSLSRP